MHVDSEDRYVEEEPTTKLPLVPIAVVVLLLAGVAYWYLSGDNNTDTLSQEPAVTAPVAATDQPIEPEPEPAPDIPEQVVAAEPVTDAADEPNEPQAEAPPEYTLETSDPVVREHLAPVLTDANLSTVLNNDDIIERSTALLDAASQGNILRKILPLTPPKEKFSVSGEGETLYTDPQSYARYDSYAKAIAAISPETLADNFHRFRPLLEQAYSALGYPAEDLDNTLIKALDQVIAAPVLEQPAALEKQITTYKYVDDSLEKLSPLAKQLMRMGPENQALIQQQAKALRKQLLSTQ